MLTANSTYQRRLDLEGTYNVRDLGGYTTSDGHSVRWRMLFRADKLDRLTPAAQQTLLSYGVRTVIDLRYQPEVVAEPDVFAVSSDITYLHLPLYELNGNGTLPVIPQDLEELYRLILDYRRDQIKTIISILATDTSLPALVHCTAGKDRTGLIIALVLGVLGVPRETIIDDYVLSARYLSALYDELRLQAHVNGFDAEWYERLLQCRPEIMEHTLDYIERHYCSVADYLLGAGLSKQQIAALRTRLIE